MRAVGRSSAMAVFRSGTSWCVCAYGSLCSAKSGAAGHHQPLRVHQPATPPRLVEWQALGDHRRHRQVGNPRRRFTRARKHQPLLRQCRAGHAQRRQQARQRDGGGALDVVVERADAVAVLAQQAERVVVGEVFELDDHAGEDRLRGVDELVDEVVVGLAGEAAFVEADVERIVQQFRCCWCPRRGPPAGTGLAECPRRPCRARACRSESPCRRRPGRPVPGCARRR